MKNYILCFIISMCNNFLFSQTKNDSVTICGYVTDYDGQPIDSVSVSWQYPNFSMAIEALTDKNGYYSARIPIGKYQSMLGIYMPSYPHTVRSGTPETDQRLEFWAWDFIADRDTTLNFSYHRMEVYGLRVFRIPGATPAYQIYVRPMSLTRTFEWIKNGKPKVCQSAPHAEKLKAVVWIDGEEVPILMKQEIKEYFTPDQSGSGYLLTVNLPQEPQKRTSYHIFKVELTDLENGDRGEGLYYMEKEHYYK